MPELEDLKKEVDEKDKQLAQMKDENDIVTKQLNQLEQTLSALNAEFKEVGHICHSAPIGFRRRRSIAWSGLPEMKLFTVCTTQGENSPSSKQSLE